ncbi:MAG: triose-phosphate isomerase [Chloroflexi bacterium]|nr:MAG: triose-phosphate isomerase [Chloroflexota bacterium]
MRTPIIAGNWKMNTTLPEARSLIEELRKTLKGIKGVEKVICPPFISLALARELLEGTDIKLGAQNMYFEERGAYTGEISPSMLSGLCEYVILGHSERRGYFGEDDKLVNKKVKAAISFGLKPILCVGERLEERDAGQTEEVVTRQVREGLRDLDSLPGLVIAYEPVWAIGTGRPATGEEANRVSRLIRGLVAELYGDTVAGELRIQYGGSVTKANIAEFISQPEIDGALVGGASLKAEEFSSIIEQTARIKGQ